MAESWLRRHPRVVLVLAQIVGVVGSVYAVELVLEWRAAPASVTTRHIRLREAPPGSEQIRTPSAELLARKPGLDPSTRVTYRVDAAGFIEPSRIHDVAELEVVFLGGSTTECEFVAAERRFPYVAGRLLEERLGRTINSYNGGRWGNTSHHSVLALHTKVIPMRPDAVVLMHAVNDLSTLLYEGGYWNEHPTRSLLVTRVSLPQRSAPVRGLKRALAAVFPQLYERAYRLRDRWGSAPPRDEFAHLRDRELDYEPDALVAEFSRSLHLFVETCRVYGITPVLMTQASRFTAEPDAKLFAEWPSPVSYRDYQQLFVRFNQTIREIATREDVALVELATAIPSDGEHIYDEVHLTAVGSTRVAEIVTAQLAPLLLGRTAPELDEGP